MRAYGDQHRLQRECFLDAQEGNLFDRFVIQDEMEKTSRTI